MIRHVYKNVLVAIIVPFYISYKSLNYPLLTFACVQFNSFTQPKNRYTLFNETKDSN